jgi:hypothetical protein
MEQMTIALGDILTLANPEDYKLHLACQNPEGVHPLDVFVGYPENWLGWNEWRGRRNDWTRPYVLSFMEFYSISDAWLFGGAFEVVERHEDGYKLKSDQRVEKYVGRLVASFHRYQGLRGRAFKLESFLDQFTVREILPEVYSGETFPGIEQINHGFGSLEAIFHSQRLDWKSALQSMKGVYVVSDKMNGKQYVGSAYGDGGIWSRWACYMETGHGWNDELMKLLKRRGGRKYARQQFVFAVLEAMSMTTPDSVVQEREDHWKHVLLSREHGYNKN